MLVGTSRYLTVQFDGESEIEKVVLENAELLFGSSAIVLPKKKIGTIGGATTIPDAVAIDLENEQWFLVEVEMASHGTWTHIAPQVAKQLTSVLNKDTRKLLLTEALKAIEGNADYSEALNELNIPQLKVASLISSILDKPPKIAIPIDAIPTDLREWADTLRVPVTLWVIEKYQHHEDKEQILYRLPDEAVCLKSSEDNEEPPATTLGQGEIFQLVLKQGLLKIGETLHLDYGPKGQPKTHFEAVVRENGLEMNGSIYSPSYAALACVQQTKPSRTTANGWMMWKKADGTLINDLAEPVLNQA